MPQIKRSQIAGMNIHYLFYSLDYFFAAQQKAGIESIELWGGAPHFLMDSMSYADCKKVKQKAAQHDVEIVAFTPESIIYPYNIAAPDPDQFEKSKLYFTNAVKAAAELGTSLMTINSGYGYLNEANEEAWKRSAEMLHHLAHAAEKEGVTIAMETLRPEESKIVTTLEEAKRMHKEINSPAFKIMLDTVAMSVAGETMEDWFAAFGEEIAHIHFVDCKPYGHLAWGDGSLDVSKQIEILNQYQYKGFLGQEITEMKYFEKPDEVDQRIMEHLTPFFNE
ncbi:sugar phosphate isomerase/epimerase [Domibacillus indicus]|uniref:sugar phosphate isomerase/epimerase family protein n=1 Tax=Domibacillus indicus TaxID=1437523 RepID=UPI00203D3023|nr:sugar phosphate isomerase/epimerase family protein [Domibacillus indicus]MCM3789306.1 sugar phosphate isomerase/epimerase [Domibacillus indicus]